MTNFGVEDNSAGVKNKIAGLQKLAESTKNKTQHGFGSIDF